MNYNLLKDTIALVEEFEKKNSNNQYSNTIEGFKHWISQNSSKENLLEQQTNWKGKAEGRSPESVISTLVVHLNRYAKIYSKAIIQSSEFSSQEEFIYLITLKSFGQMTKMDLIRKNVHEKSAGMEIIRRLLVQNWIEQNHLKKISVAN